MAMISIGAVNRRTLVLGGVGLLVVAAGAGWYFFGDELLGEPAPPVATKAGAPVAAKPAPKPEAKPAAAPPAAAQAKSPAQPIPDNPDAAVAEIMARSGIEQFAAALRQGALQGMEAAPNRPANLTPQGAQAYRDAINQVLAPEKVTAQIRGRIRSAYEPAQFARFIEVLRQPINAKMTRLESETPDPEQIKQFFEKLRTQPVPAERQALLRRIDAAARTSEWGAEVSVIVIRGLLEGAAAGAAPAGAKPAAPANLEPQLEQIRKGVQMQIRALLNYTYRNASDAELKEYAALLESEPGRWGIAMLSNAVKTAMDALAHELGEEVARVAAEQVKAQKAAADKAEGSSKPAAQAGARGADVAQAQGAEEDEEDEEPVVRAEERRAPAASAPPPRAAARPGAQSDAARGALAAQALERRRAELPILYPRYNDVITAVTMGDREAASELIADGKNPDARTSSGQTALMVAVQNRDLDMAQLLLSRGANPNLRAADGATALGLARAANNPAMVSLLASYGARP